MRNAMTAAIAALGMMGAIAALADEPKRSVGEYTDDKILVGKVVEAAAAHLERAERPSHGRGLFEHDHPRPADRQGDGR